MNIQSLEQMEQLVKSNKNLRWDGWTVVNYIRSDKARTSKFGEYINGKWYIVKRFSPNRDGWSIPESLINAQIKMEG
jgi:hypothetical protein